MNRRLVIALLLLAPSAAADQDRGILLTREAQKLIAAGRAEEAVPLLEQARVEWPDSAVVTQTLADAQLATGNYRGALAEYERGSQGAYEHRSRFNSAVTLDRMAEHSLEAAGVPLDPAGLPEGPQPEMLTAIQEALPVLETSRGEFLRALDAVKNAATRESIGAVNRRIDDLEQMAEELQRRQDEQDQQQEDENQDGEPEDQEPQEGDQDQEQQPGDQDQEQDGEPEDEPQDGEGEEGEDQQPPEGEQQGEPAEPRLLSREEVQQLLEKLDELEQEGRELRKMRAAAARREVEKDW